MTVIDADCLNFLLSFKIGTKILNNVEIKLPTSIFNELDQKNQLKLKQYKIQIVNLDQKDREYAANILYKINGRKEIRKWYLENRNLRLIHHIGESEGAAIAKKLNEDIVLLEKKSTSIIKKTFQHLQINCIHLKQFGIDVLNNLSLNKDIEIFNEELKRKLHIF